MRWKGRKQSSNVEDRRGTTVRGGGGGPVAGGAIGSLLFALFRRGSGKTKLILIVGVIAACFMFKINPISLFMSTPGGGSSQVVSQKDYQPTAAEQEMFEYLKTLKGDNETIWAKIMAAEGLTYRPAKMVVYTQRTSTPGGIADAQMGPFYLPANETIYIDPSFFSELEQRFKAKGDFAQAYVIAHEVGHHIQKLLGLTDKVHGQQGRISKTEYNRLSVRLELQADFLAGVFAHHGQEKFNFLENGDIEEAMRCAEAIGDDRIQQHSHGHVQPDLFTHGTSEQRKRWFMRGYQSGRIRDGNTFDVPYNEL
ncbi:neutral zinc metallopeptidase [Verrucomicrobiaceae bacterium R5-34]|uniref:Neutral zinc metallopeptidase n=1 Tax=Oceaniferula flava TaxID=2800421 RepID=A0AAE2SBD8_9BACT|nr:neutral zinc metallopeptidase [Oceaniferula flavus]MBK1830096.1 neutral zinc metallopeptidase [Verrucomicrobiaceae bacterium R5-34]MBK1855035.1 neutral zinc metallopeptidase [Oceaniferula flavus]MBM1136341.1 neutral zinc metallopeptidase [Oceaniferula flavus]